MAGPRSSARVLIVGCGQVGSRHLQAVATLPHVAEIEVVDPRPEALVLGQERLAEVPDRNPRILWRWLSSVEMATAGGDLCIVATQAQGRCQIVRRVVKALGYTSFLLEKLVAPSIGECEQIVEFSREQHLSVWVNCKARAYAFHQWVKQRVDPSEPLLVSVIGGNHGLTTNGIHAADLFAFYDNASHIEPVASSIDAVLHRTKRGTLDLSGVLHGGTEKGSRFLLSYAGDPHEAEMFTIATRRFRWLVDHFQRWAMESDIELGWVWRPVPFTENILISHMTKVFAADLLGRGQCALPTLEQAMVAHRFILGALQPHFSRLLGRDVEQCPVA